MLWNRAFDVARILRRILDLLERDDHRRLAGKGALAGEHFEQNQTERVNIATLINGRSLSLFRRHIRRSADGSRRSFGDEVRQTEVHQLDVAGSVDHEIFRLEIPVHDALGVRLAKAVADLARDLDCGARA